MVGCMAMGDWTWITFEAGATVPLTSDEGITLTTLDAVGQVIPCAVTAHPGMRSLS
eukprot:CAMPEP_0173427660 /NCGR_PEP_ID=MMETSP1357-20121228/6810_1 /TAXON_ID=77926 /ORGANISM="Hemiselmis rufescens, Strain PCC563" /LENGTH=55 /DNA_ID=CAMNT_0014391543 /DNA_START=124 /DNA_END=291 /DNA_ORIENTATION=-